mgnify:CR=1 FL=1
MGLLDFWEETINLKNSYHECKNDFEKMFEIQKRVVTSQKKVIKLDATECTYISPTCFIILSSLVLYNNENKKIQISFKKGSKLREKLIDFGFINIEHIKNTKTIPLNKIQTDDDAYLKIQEFVECSPLKNIPQEKKDEIVSRLYEIPYNALHHSQIQYGIICCGYYTKSNEFWFSVYDLGIGIPKSVRDYLKKPNLSSRKAIEWALKEGNSTNEDYSRGLGFYLLEEFKNISNGKIVLISEDIVYTSNKGKPTKSKLKSKMSGTLYTIKIMV